MNITNLFLIGGGVLAGLLIVSLMVLFLVSRRSQRVMESLLQLMTQPERAQINDASRVLQTILAGEIAKIEACFRTMRDTLNAQIDAANTLAGELTDQNDKLVALADDATKKIAVMSQRLDNTVSGLNGIVDSSAWGDIQKTTDDFNTTVNELLDKINTTTNETTNQTNTIKSQIDQWVATSETLNQNLKSGYDTNEHNLKTCNRNYLNWRRLWPMALPGSRLPPQIMKH